MINPLLVRPCLGARAPPRNRRNGRNESSGGLAEARNKGRVRDLVKAR